MPDEIRIGEKMSVITDMEGLLGNSYGDLFQGRTAIALDRPLTTGQLFYAKLRRALAPDIEVEVYWNHFYNLITGVVSGREVESEVSFVDTQMARPDKVVYIEQLVERFKEAVPSLE